MELGKTHIRASNDALRQTSIMEDVVTTAVNHGQTFGAASGSTSLFLSLCLFPPTPP